MLKYSIMSRSGKVNVQFLDYENALKLFHEMKDLWNEPYKSWKDGHVSYIYENGKIKKSGFITDEQFLNECKPTECWKMWYEGTSSCIVDNFKIIEDEIITNEEEGYSDKLFYEKIMMSNFERDLLPEFDGF